MVDKRSSTRKLINFCAIGYRIILYRPVSKAIGKIPVIN